MTTNVNSQLCVFCIHLRMMDDNPNGGKVGWIQSQKLYEVCHENQTFFASTSSPRAPSQAQVCFFPPPYLSSNFSISNPILPFHLISFIQAKLSMESSQSADPFVLQLLQLLTFTASTAFTCLVVGSLGLFLAGHKSFQQCHSH